MRSEHVKYGDGLLFFGQIVLLADLLDIRYQDFLCISDHGLLVTPMVWSVVDVPVIRKLKVRVTCVGFSLVEKLRWKEVAIHGVPK